MTLQARPSMFSPSSAASSEVTPEPPSTAPSTTRGVHRPANVARTLFHLASGGLALAFVELLPTRGWLITAASLFATAAWTCEITRRRIPAINARVMRLFGPIAHAHEYHRVNSATWYATALVLMSLVVPLDAAALGVVVLAVADPMAGFFGRRFGRHRLASGRSLEGAAAFATSGALASLAWMTASGSFAGSRLLLALVAGVVGAVIELFSKVDDNLAIPLGTSVAVAVAALLG